MRFLAIDPGIDTGFATFGVNGRLMSCGLGIPPAGGHGDVVIIEKPQVYAARLSKGDPNDLITLAVQVGQYKERFEAAGATVGLVTPHTWKGTVRKLVHHARILKALDADESTVVLRASQDMPKSKVHNMLDAIGLGKWAYAAGRFR